MKRWIAGWLAAMLLFGFSACSMSINTQEPPTEPTTADPNAYPRVSLTAQEAHETLTDDEGNTVITVESRIPRLTAGLEEGKLNMMNHLFDSLRAEMRDRAVKNIKNAAADLKRSGNGKPWLYKMDYTVTYADAGFLCVLLVEQFSTMGNPKADPVYHTKMLDLLTGRVCPVTLFAYDNADAAIARANIEEMIAQELRKNFRVNGAKAHEEEILRIAAGFDEYTYWFMQDGTLVFPLDCSSVGESAGYLCRISPATAETLFDTPLSYRKVQEDNAKVTTAKETTATQTAS